MLKSSFILIFIIITAFSCERIKTTDVLNLLFSEDTILFDTVFATIGSTTRELRVINLENRKIHIDDIFLSGGQGSQFRLNIDGEPGFEKHDIDLEAGDSIYIFIDALIDPTGEDAPIAVADSIIFMAGDKILKVQLLAWGQDIFLINRKIITSETWHNSKPYVIYDNVTVDTLETLLIEEGTRIYFHRNASLTVAGTLIVNGSVESPVIFSGDRLEKMYEDIPGQWKGMFFLNSSKGNRLNHTIIRNTVYGIQLGENNPGNENPVLKIFSSSISHSTVSGLSALNGIIEAANCIFAHCGSYCIYLAGGGDYSFTNCSVFNRWEYGYRLYPSLYVSEKPAITGGRASQINLGINNSVVFGDNVSELEIVPQGNSFTGNYYFDHCLFRLDTAGASFWNRNKSPGTIINTNPRFIDNGTWDLRPDTLSPLINAGNPVYISSYPFDYRGVSRSGDGKPDIGAYERIPGEHKKDK